MCVIAIKTRDVQFPSYERVKNMCDNNDDGFAIVYHVIGEHVKQYRTLNKEKFLNKYQEISTTHDASDVALFIHARIKTHGSEKLENCHGWIDDDLGLAFAHNGILSIKNRGDLTDSETFFRDIFVPIFKVGGWDAGIKAINAVIGTSKFVFMDFKGDIAYFGNYIKGDDDILYSNNTYSYKKYAYGGNYYGKYASYVNPNYKKYADTPTTKKTSADVYDYFDYDDWHNNEDWWG